ncbi:MAG: four helix bundle suffix domain-containing protein [Muribaculaceae bacterium]|nr:four helix bundle suffix domain-containing protein [Muribaculaceae bacterium]
MEQDKSFLPQRGDYKQLAVYQIAQCIFVITHYFANNYFSKGDRTIDQMIQAARSGKQNIVEASIDGNTSREMEIKLMNVARGSMHELQADYEDFLITHNFCTWSNDDPRTQQMRSFARRHNDPEIYLEKIKQRSPETIANVALTLIHQYDYLMVRLIERIKRRFLEEGGIKEEMYRARINHRKQ